MDLSHLTPVASVQHTATTTETNEAFSSAGRYLAITADVVTSVGLRISLATPIEVDETQEAASTWYIVFAGSTSGTGQGGATYALIDLGSKVTTVYFAADAATQKFGLTLLNVSAP